MSLAVLALIVVVATMGITDYYRMREHELWRRAAAWAADAQLQRYHVGVALGTPPPPNVVQPEVTLSTATEPGQGQWQGLTHVTVTATVTVRTGARIRQTSRGYIRREAGP